MVQGKDFTLGFTFLKDVHSLFILLVKAIVNLRKREKSQEGLRKMNVDL